VAPRPRLRKAATTAATEGVRPYPVTTVIAPCGLVALPRESTIQPTEGLGFLDCPDWPWPPRQPAGALTRSAIGNSRAL
jgi:hypothetical protein